MIPEGGNGAGQEDGFKAPLQARDHQMIENIKVEGEWEIVSSPRIGDVIMVESSFSSGDADVQVLLDKGLRGEVVAVCADGDIQIFFPRMLQGAYSHFPWWFAVRRVLKNQLGECTRRKCVDQTNAPG